MIAQHPNHRGGSAVPPWARYLILLISGAVQVVPVLAGAYLIGTAGASMDDRPFSLERLAAGLAFLGSAATMLYAVYQDWRGGRRLNQSPVILASIALLVIGLLALMP